MKKNLAKKIAVLSRTKLWVYAQGRTNSANVSEVEAITYPSTSVNAAYNNYSSAYINDYYRTYVKIDATAAYSPWTVPGKTEP